MSDPAAGGVLVPALDGSAWANGGPRFGDMVWGKVKSHPWWPGHIYSITLTDDEEVRRGHRDGLVLVAFFGDSSYGWFEAHELVPFEDHFAEKAAQGGVGNFAAAVAEAVDEVARRSALALLCPCQNPSAFRPHPSNPRFLLVDVPGFDSDADYHPDQVDAARERFVPQKALDHLLEAAVTQRDAAEAAARTVQGIEMAALFAAFRRARFEPIDTTYAEAFGVDPEKALAAERKAAAERSQRARPLKGNRKTPKEATVGRRRGGAGGAAARLMEKIVPGASAMKAKANKKDQYLLKRRDPPPEPSHRPAPLPDAPAALDEGPPGFGDDPPTPPHVGSAGTDAEEYMLQPRALAVEAPPAAAASDGVAAATDAAPKKATKPKKARKREREEAAGPSTDADAGPAGEPKKKKKKKKKLSDVELGALPTASASGAAGGKSAALSPPKLANLDGLDLQQVISELRDLPLSAGHGADCHFSDPASTFILAFRSKYYKKSYDNDPPEESKKTLSKPIASADGQPLKKKKPVGRPPGSTGGDPTKTGVKRGPSDRQEELAVKKKAKLDKIKTLSNDKKAGGVELKTDVAVRPGIKEKAEMVARKMPAPAARVRTPSPTALMMKFPQKSTLPSVASLKARFARFGPLIVDGIRVYWKSHMCRVIYKYKSDAEAALKYAKSNNMFGQVDTQYHLREVESAGGSEPAVTDAPPQRSSDLRLMETAPFRPGSSGNGAPLALSRATPARPAMGQQPRSILKKSTDEGASAVREVSRVKFVLDGGDSPPPMSVGGNSGADPPVRGTKSVGFASQPMQPPPPARSLQPPMRPAQQLSQPPMRPPQQPSQPPRAAVAQPLPPPPPLQQHLPYQPRTSEGMLPYPPRHTDGLPPFSVQPPSQPLPYPPRHSDNPLAHPGQPPLPYQPRTGFPGQQQPYPPRSGDCPLVLPGQRLPPQPTEDVPAWKRSEKEFKEELMRVMTGIAKMVEPLTDKNGFFPYHLFRPM